VSQPIKTQQANQNQFNQNQIQPSNQNQFQSSNNPRQQQLPSFEIDNNASQYSEPSRPQQTSKFGQGPPASRLPPQPTPSPVPPPSANQPTAYFSQRPSTVVNPTNCDISTDTSQMTDRRKVSAQQFRPQENPTSFMGPPTQRNPRGKSPMVQQQQPQTFRQQNRPGNMDDMMMTSQQGMMTSSRGPEASGGYNFQRVMDDHFEHYKRPPSRERSVDLTNLPSSLVEAKVASRTSRPPSRNRTPLPSNPVHNNPAPAAATTDTLDGAMNRIKRSGSGARVGATPAPAGEPKTNGLFTDPLFGDTGGVRYRAPSQEVSHIGAIPKRTESLYLKTSIATDSKGVVSDTILFSLYFFNNCIIL